MDVTLPPELEQFVSERVAAGEYESTNAVIREGLRLLQERSQEEQRRLAELRAAIDEGIAAADRGELIAADEAFAWLRHRRGRGDVA